MLETGEGVQGVSAGRVAKGWRGLYWGAIALLVLLSGVFFFFDHSVIAAARSIRHISGDETTRLGELLQLARPFGLAEVVILLGVVFGLAGQRRIFKKIILALFMVLLIVQPVKGIVGRERPNGSNFSSFPSGDTATAFVLPEAFAGNVVLCAAGVAAGVIVGASRVFFDMHFPLDVFFGAACGLFAGLAGAWLARRIRWLPGEGVVLLTGGGVLLFMLICAIIDAHHRHMVQFLAWYGPVLAFYVAHKRLRVIYGRKPEDREGAMHNTHGAGGCSTAGAGAAGVKKADAVECASSCQFGGCSDDAAVAAGADDAPAPAPAAISCGGGGGCGGSGSGTVAAKMADAYRHRLSGRVYYMLRRALWFCGVLGVLLMTVPWLVDAPGMRNPAFSAGLLLLAFSHFTGKNLRGNRLSAMAADFATLLYIVQIYVAGYIFGIL